jgi:hypothetical protein
VVPPRVAKSNQVDEGVVVAKAVQEFAQKLPPRFDLARVWVVF